MRHDVSCSLGCWSLIPRHVRHRSLSIICFPDKQNSSLIFCFFGISLCPLFILPESCSESSSHVPTYSPGISFTPLLLGTAPLNGSGSSNPLVRIQRNFKSRSTRSPVYFVLFSYSPPTQPPASVVHFLTILLRLSPTSFARSSSSLTSTTDLAHSSPETKLYICCSFDYRSRGLESAALFELGPETGRHLPMTSLRPEGV